jgi:hypothetical protein
MIGPFQDRRQVCDEFVGPSDHRTTANAAHEKALQDALQVSAPNRPELPRMSPVTGQ